MLTESTLRTESTLLAGSALLTGALLMGALLPESLLTGSGLTGTARLAGTLMRRTTDRYAPGCRARLGDPPERLSIALGNQPQR